MLSSWLATWDESGLTALNRPGYLWGYWTLYTVSRQIDNLSRLASLKSKRNPDRDRLAVHIARDVWLLAAHVEYDIVATT